MIKRELLEQREIRDLAPYACYASKSRGRQFIESPSPYRTIFQRDRDRILHAAAFRRMEYKTQVFVNHEGDHYRTRLTHTLEVAQIGRSVGRLLALNEDLIEALVLSHDLGHTPFGHAGERVLSSLMKEYGGFEHNAQSLRVVDYLEHRYPTFRGLNLSFEVREGIIKHSSHWRSQTIASELAPLENPGIESQLIDYVDEIAYNNHDLDDGLSSGMLDVASLQQVELFTEAKKIVEKLFPNTPWERLKYTTISTMISMLVDDLVVETEHNIRDSGIETYEDVRAYPNILISFSKSMDRKNKELKQFLWDHLYTHYRVVRMEEKAQRVIEDLFQTLMNRPEQLPTSYVNEQRDYVTPQVNSARLVCDYIAGMTDRFAIEEHQKLFNPNIRV